VSIGQFEAATPDFRVLEEGSEESYLRFVFREARMVGAVLLGKFAVGAAAKKAIENKVDCAAVLTSNTTARDVVSFLESPG
jgi:NAD(P)H-nitrite reductase large subunit